MYRSKQATAGSCGGKETRMPQHERLTRPFGGALEHLPLLLCTVERRHSDLGA